jgi:hypothetical protein
MFEVLSVLMVELGLVFVPVPVDVEFFEGLQLNIRAAVTAVIKRDTFFIGRLF